jgi:quinolinate synthase
LGKTFQEHAMILWQPSLPERYHDLTEDELAQQISARRQELGDDLLILGHHYQQDSVVKHADLRGDSLKLSQLAAEVSAARGTKYIVFCGVHFMAETAEILTDDSVQVILPDLSAGCSMADMADYDDTVDAWERIHMALGSDWNGRVIPITYVNSTAAIKAFVGDHGGACCTSSNADQIFRWAIHGGTQPRGDDEDIRILFLPDQHLGRNTASKFGLLTEVDEAQGRGDAQTAIYDPKQDAGGITDEAIRRATVLLWAGHCSVHKLFRPEHVGQARRRFANTGGVNVIVHPECCKDVVDLADLSGSTEFIINAIHAAEPGSNWSVGTEVHLVNRLADEMKSRDVTVEMLSECQCLCTTMYRIDPAHLLWVLDNLAQGTVVNRIEVNARAQELATLALDRMLANVAQKSGTRAGRQTT